MGFKANFVFAENLEEADLLVACNKGILPIESVIKQAESDGAIKTIPLYYKQNQMSRKYYAFWKKWNQNPVISDFANILKKVLIKKEWIKNDLLFFASISFTYQKAPKNRIDYIWNKEV